MELKDIKVGAPYLFNSTNYGPTAVHVTSIYRGLVHFTIDGGESSRQARDFPELSDGKYFAISERIVKRPTRVRAPKKNDPTEILQHIKIPEVRERVKNTIREVPGVGKVAVITTAPKVSDIDLLEKMPAMQLCAYARTHYSTIGKLTKKADIIQAIRAIENTEETF